MKSINDINTALLIVILSFVGFCLMVLLYFCVGYLFKRLCLNYRGYNAIPNSESLINVGICCRYGYKSTITNFKDNLEDLELLTHKLNEYSAEPIKFKELCHKIGLPPRENDYEISYV